MYFLKINKSEGLPSYCPLCPETPSKLSLPNVFRIVHTFQDYSTFTEISASLLSSSICSKSFNAFRRCLYFYVVLAQLNPSQFTQSALSPEIQCPFPSLHYWLLELLSLLAKANPSQPTLKRKRSSLLHDRKCDCAREPSKAKPGYTTTQEERSLQCPIPPTLGSAQGF